MTRDRPEPIVDRPVRFALLATLTFIVALVVLVLVAAPVGTPMGSAVVGAVGRLALSALLIGWVVRRGWSDATGIGARPDRRSSLEAAPLLVYLLVVYPLLFTGRLTLNLEDPGLATWTALSVAGAALLEELVFRGLILAALMGRWGDSAAGTRKAVLVSSALFSAPHALNLLSDADPVFVVAQLGWSFLLGGTLAMLVLSSGSLWTAVAVHALANVFVHLNRLGVTVAPSPAMGLLLVLATLPAVAYGLLLLRRRADRSVALITPEV